MDLEDSLPRLPEKKPLAIHGMAADAADGRKP